MISEDDKLRVMAAATILSGNLANQIHGSGMLTKEVIANAMKAAQMLIELAKQTY